jgi:hypothetical protein
MTIDRELWLTTWFINRDTPPWPCPLCKHGTLRIETRRGGRIRRRELRARRRRAKRRRMFRRIFGLRPKKYRVPTPDLMFLESSRFHTASWIEPASSVFCATLCCDNPKCSEAVTVAGVTYNVIDEVITRHEGDDYFYPRYVPRVFYPPLVIFEIPKATPRDIHDEVTVAFELFWSNPNACLNRIRVATEFLLTYLGIPTLKPNGYFLTLGNRIPILRDTYPALAVILDKIKVLANTASHQASTKPSEALDGIELIKQALEILFGAIVYHRSDHVPYSYVVLPQPTPLRV